jgi:tetratricopeptide (TPR) repeat protein
MCLARSAGPLLLLTAFTAASQPESAPPEASQSQIAQAKLAFQWNERGIAATNHGDFTEAVEDYGKALEIWRTLGPEYKLHTSTTLYNLAQAYCPLGKWRESVPVFQEALDLARATAGLRNIRTLIALTGLGKAYMITGDLNRAEAAFTEALPAARTVIPNNAELASLLGNFASLRMRQGNLAEALPLADEALSLTIRLVGEVNGDTATVYTLVATIHQRTGHSERAVPLFRKAHWIYDKTIPPSDPRYACLLASEGLAMVDEKHFAAAEKQMRQAIDLLTPCGAACMFPLAVAETDFGLLRLSQKKYTEADSWFRSALAREQQYSAQPSGDVLQTLKLLMALRQEQGRTAEAAVLRQRIDAVQAAYR